MAETTIAKARNAIYVSDASMWETAIKRAKRPDVLARTARRFSCRCDAMGFVRLRLERSAIEAYEGLDTSAADVIHEDPFGRMFIAQARDANMLLATHDRNMRLYGEPHVMMF